MIASILVTAYGIVFFHMAIFVLVLKNKGPAHFFFAGFLCVYGLMCLVGGAGAVQERPAPVYYVVTLGSILSLAPLGALYIIAFLGTVRGNPVIWAIAAPVAPVFAFVTYLGYGGLSWKKVLGLGYAYLLASLISVGIRLYSEIGPYRNLTKNLKLFFTCLWGASVQLFALCVVQLLEIRPAMHFFWILITVTVMLHFTLVQRNPEIYREYSKQTSMLRERKSRLAGVDVKARLERLRRALADEKAYLDPELQIEDLSSRVGLSPPQLSELVNRHLEVNFNTLINEYRVAEAKAKLAGSPDRSVLDIAFDCGFASKSSFNLVFRKMTGQSPREYRNSNRE